MTTVMVAGAWDEKRPEILSAAENVGVEIARHGWTLVTGGGSGVAAAAERGARRELGVTVAVIGTTLHEDDESTYNEKYKVQVYTDQGWDGRSLVAVKSSNAVIVIGGKNGTLLEIAAAYLSSTPVIVLSNSSEMIGRLEPFLDHGYIDERHNIRIQFQRDVTGIVKLLEKLTEYESSY